MLVIVSADVEKHARNFMEAAKKLQEYFICLQRENKPTKAETLKRVKSTRNLYIYIYRHTHTYLVSYFKQHNL